MTRKVHTKRPPSPGGQIAWDAFVRRHEQPPKEMWFTSLSYPCWVAEFADGSTDDFDNLEFRTQRSKPKAKEKSRTFGGIHFTWDDPYWTTKLGIRLLCGRGLAGPLSAHWQATWKDMTVAGMTADEAVNMMVSRNLERKAKEAEAARAMKTKGRKRVS